MSSASLKQIAQASNVSIATVSRVLRGKGEVADRTRQHVLRTAKRFKYRPNLLVQGMQTGKTRTIGVMVSVRSPFHAEVAVGIHDELIAADHVPIILWPYTGPHKKAGFDELEQIHRLVDRRVDGVILAPVADAASDDYFHEVWDRDLPLVAVDRQLPHAHADFVGTDDEAGGRLAAEHLLTLGHRRLGHVAGPGYASTGRLRRLGFEQAVGEVQDATCLTSAREGFTSAHGREITLDMLSCNPSLTAIFAANDQLAEGVYQAAVELGLSIPRDLSVVGFADLPYARWMAPRLTTIRQQPYEIGRRAARLVLRRLTGELEAEPRCILLEPEWVERESTLARSA